MTINFMFKAFASFSTVLFAVLFISSCGSTDANNGFPIEGNWEENGNPETPLYLKISSEKYTEYENYSPGECYYEQSYEILEKDGNNYTIQNLNEGNQGEETQVRIVVNDNVLTLESDITFEKTEENPASFNLCNE